EAPFTPADGPAELRVVGKAKRGVTGTRVRYWADPQIFIKGSHFALDELHRRARQTAVLVPGLQLSVTDERPERLPAKPPTRTYTSDGGLPGYLQFRAQAAKITDSIRPQRTAASTEPVPVLDKNGHMVSTAVDRTCEVDLALRWGADY